jgi:transcriptional regulator with XRE-family HTH domain
VAIGAGIKRARVARGMTLETLARLCGVTVGQVSRWERGSAEPRLRSLRVLRRELRISVDELLDQATS